MTPDRWLGSRDRSWGIRPVGEAPPAGAPLTPEFEGMWWLYVPMRFDDFMLCLIIQEEPDGYRALNDCHRVWSDGRIEQLGWPQVQVRYASGTRVPTGATITCTTPEGKPLVVEVESLLAVPLHVGGGYGGDTDWSHGVWKGAGFTERVTYDMTAPDVAGRVMFGVIDHVGRATIDGAGGLGPLRARRPRPPRPLRLRRLVHPRPLIHPHRLSSAEPRATHRRTDPTHTEPP